MTELKEQKPNYLYFSQDFFEILLAKRMTKIWHDQLCINRQINNQGHAWIHFSSVDRLYLFCLAKARVSPRDLYTYLQRSTYVCSTEVSGNHY